MAEIEDDPIGRIRMAMVDAKCDKVTVEDVCYLLPDFFRQPLTSCPQVHYGCFADLLDIIEFCEGALVDAFEPGRLDCDTARKVAGMASDALVLHGRQSAVSELKRMRDVRH